MVPGGRLVSASSGWIGGVDRAEPRSRSKTTSTAWPRAQGQRSPRQVSNQAMGDRRVKWAQQSSAGELTSYTLQAAVQRPLHLPLHPPPPALFSLCPLPLFPISPLTISPLPLPPSLPAWRHLNTAHDHMVQPHPKPAQQPALQSQHAPCRDLV